MRSRLLRRIGIAHLDAVIDLGCGAGSVTAELRRRCRGQVHAVDRDPAAVDRAGPPAAVAEASKLPFDRDSIDLVFAQNFFLWNRDRTLILKEIERVLTGGGTLLALEPDFGGAIEFPEEVAVSNIYSDALARAGADPSAGRRLIVELRSAGFNVRTEVSPVVGDPDRRSLALLRELDLTAAEERWVARANLRYQPPAVAHIPYLFIEAARPA